MLRNLLVQFIAEAASELGAAAAAGEELPFELVEAGARGRGGPVLYCYRPETEGFIEQRAGALRLLPGHAASVRMLAQHSSLESYLMEQGARQLPAAPAPQAEAALVLLLKRIYAGRSDFAFDERRFDAAYAELERSLLEGACLTVVAAPLLGLELDADTAELELGGGLSVLRWEQLHDPPPEALWEPSAGALLATLTLHEQRDSPPAVGEARARLRRMLTALRLYERGRFALGPVAWVRRDGGSWRGFPLGVAGRPGAPARIGPGQEDELRAFTNLVARRAPQSGEVAWALSRFEMGLERLSPLEALSDHLLALRALLEPEGPGSGRLPQRLAAICATPDQRARLAARVAAAVELERQTIAGLASGGGAAGSVAEEMAEHLRAVLRDVICGHLEADLCGVADELLAEAAQAPEPVLAR